MAEMFEFVDNRTDGAVIKVVGVGGGGSNTVNQMVEAGIEGVEFICANTDAQHLESCRADRLIQLGPSTTRGLGAGADPNVGRQSAEEVKEEIRQALEGTDMLFVTAGMGGGTGTGAAPVVAQVARELGILTLAVVTKPFPFERAKRMQIAKQGIDQLHQYVDSLIVIPNEKLPVVLGKDATLLDAFKSANDVLQNAVQGISDLITRPGMLNVDFADVRRVMSVQGMAMMGLGKASGDNRAREAAEAALSSPLLEELNLTGAEGILVNVTCDAGMGISEFQTVNEIVVEMAADDADVIVGTAIDESLEGELRVTVVATGLGRPAMSKGPSLVAGQSADASTQHAEPQAVPTQLKTSGGEPNWDVYNKPTVIRQEPTQQRRRIENLPDMNDEYLDVPAFLRHQAD